MKQLAPGFIVAAAFIGPGTVTTATLTGANFGFALVWALFFSVFATLILQEMAARLGVSTNLGLAEAIRSQLHKPLLSTFAMILIVAAIGVGNAAYEAGNLTGAAIGISNIFGGSTAIWASTLGIFAAIVLLIGGFNFIKWFLTGLVLLMSLVFLMTMIMSGVDIKALVSGTTSIQIPENGLTATLAIIGTTVVPYNLFLHASLASQYDSSANKADRIKALRKDALLAISLGGLITLAIMATAMASFYGGTDTPDMKTIADQLTPLLGDWAPYFFAAGLFAAGLTSALTAPIAGAYAVCGAMKWSTETTSKTFQTVALAILGIGIIFSFLQLKPLELILLAQAANGLLLPIIACFLLWVVNQKSLMAEAANSLLLNVIGIVVLVVISGLSIYKLSTLF